MTHPLPDVLDPEGELTPDQIETMAQFGLLVPRTKNNLKAHRVARTKAQRKRQELLRTSLTIEQVAEHMKMRLPQIQRKIGRGTLYAVPGVEPLQLPLFQFTEAGVLPGWPHVMSELSPQLDPLVMLGFMTTIREELSYQGASVSPLRWLQMSQPVRAVVDLAKEFTERGGFS